MSLSLFARKLGACLFLAVAGSLAVKGQTNSNFLPQGGEYNIAGALPGDQVLPKVSVNANGGYLVWEDNRTDGDGLGVSALQLDNNFSAKFSPFRVNEIGAGDQENPQVTLLNGGGAVFVWQGGPLGYQHIYARFLSASNTWLTGDVMVNATTNYYQINPAVAVLNSGNVVVVYASFGQQGSGSMQDVFGQLFSPAGQKIGGEFPVNQFTAYNQRTPAVAALSGGGFAVVWVSEQERSAVNLSPVVTTVGQDGQQPVYTTNWATALAPPSQLPQPSVDIYGRIYDMNGAPIINEFLLNSDFKICANPSVAGAPDGSFMVVWGEKDNQVVDNGWDVFERHISLNMGIPVEGNVWRLNTQLYGDQYAPQICAWATSYLTVWTSMGQDGSWEGVYGQFLNWDGSHSGGEFRVNTTTASKQMQPAVASDGTGRFIAVWTSFVDATSGFDLYAQRYATILQPLTAPSPPFVTALSSNAISVTWPDLTGFNVAGYEVYADGATTPTAIVTNDIWTMTGLAPSSAHTFQLDYVLTDGRRSPLSGPASGTTYSTLTWGGIPYDWMVRYFGSDISKWPAPNADSDGDGVSTLNEFLAGTDPTDPNSVLKAHLVPTSQGLFLSWNAQPGLVYQVQTSTNMASWTNLGGPRVAADSVDSVYVGTGGVSYFRVVRLRD